MRTLKFKILLPIVSLILIGGSVAAQVDRSEPPKPGPAPEIKFEEPTSFTLDNGLQVIVSENHEMPLVSFQLAVDVDPVKEGDAVGYVSAAGNLLRNGTENREKAEIDESVDFIGASLNTYENGIYATSLTKHSDKLLDVMADVVKNPTFPEKEVDKYKQKTKSSLASSSTNASFIAQRVARKLRNGDHPYGELETKKTIDNISRDLCENYHGKYFRPNVSYLVMVGDITPEKAKNYAEKYFGDWEKAEVPEHEHDFPKRENAPRVALVNKEDAVQSVISITYPVKLQVGDPDAIEANVTNNILGGGVFSGYLMQNLREDKGYTYGARSSLVKDENVGYFKASAEVGTEVTDSAVHEFLYEMNRIRDEKVDEEHLNLVKNVITGKFARSLEDAQTKAKFALNTKRYDLPADYYSNYLKKVEAVTVEDVNKTAKEYILPEASTILVVGNKEKVSDKLKRFSDKGKVQLYSKTGEPIEESKKAVPADLTATKVIEKYIEAIGGRENLQNINSYKRVASVSMGGRTITIKEIRKAPGKFATITEMNGNVMQKQVYNGKKAMASSMGQKREITGKKLKNMKYQAKLFKFLKYDELGVKLELQGIENVDGEDVYKIKVTNPAGKHHYDYYSVDSGLKIKTKSKQQTRQGKVTTIQKYSDYKEENGVLFPHTINISGMRSMTLTVDSYKINQEIDDSAFEL
jgi:predicted Zn-dependent peptidase